MAWMGIVSDVQGLCGAGFAGTARGRFGAERRASGLWCTLGACASAAVGLPPGESVRRAL